MTTTLDNLVLELDFDGNSGVSDTASNVVDHIKGSHQINDALVDSHLKAIPRVGTLTTRGLTGSDAENLGGQANRAREVLLSELLVDEGSLLDNVAGCMGRKRHE